MNGNADTSTSRIIVSAGGKGGTGKTGVMTSLVSWFDINKIPVQLLDLDVENKSKGSLYHYYSDRAIKVNIHTPAGLDVFIDHITEGAPIIIADMGASSGQVTTDWFNQMYPSVKDAGIVFTLVGVITDDPASVESVLDWGAKLQKRVSYVVAKNSISEYSQFNYWDNGEKTQEFMRIFDPAIINIPYRLPELEALSRNYGTTLSDIASRKINIPELRKASLVMRAESLNRNIFNEFDHIKENFLL